MQYASLHTQLTKLDKNINTLKSNVNAAASYAPAFHKLQIIHASEYVELRSIRAIRFFSPSSSVLTRSLFSL